MTTLYYTVTVYLINTYVGLLCIVSVHMGDHFVLHCLPHQYLCGTTLYRISTYVGPLCISLFTSPVPMWDHIVLYQYLCGTTLYCTVYFTSTYVDHFVLYQYLCGTTLYCTVYLIRTYVGPLCIATVGICLMEEVEEGVRKWTISCVGGHT